MGTATLLEELNKSADKWNDQIVGARASQSEDSVKARMMQEFLDDLRTMPDKLFRRNSLFKETPMQTALRALDFSCEDEYGRRFISIALRAYDIDPEAKALMDFVAKSYVEEATKSWY